MGKKRRRVTSPKFVRKFATKFAKFKAALENTTITTAEVEKEEIVEKAPKVVVKETDKSVISEQKPKSRSAKNSPRKKSPDLKKKTTKRKTTKRKTTKKN